jgi:hypothetical protein
MRDGADYRVRLDDLDIEACALRGNGGGEATGPSADNDKI